MIPVSPIGKKEILRIVICLTVTCLVASVILGVVYQWTEPAKRTLTAKREAELVRELLELKEGAIVLEVKRYLIEGEKPSMGYLLEKEFRLYDLEGNFLKSLEAPPPESHLIGRFFIAKDPDGNGLGYVTEASQYGFKSHIRFFVALDTHFQIRGVEVISHEEDPGLGAEITKPFFKNQFIGKTREQMRTLRVSKEPMSETISPDSPIYAVTGATISSRALTDGVRKAVEHLSVRLNLILPKGEK